MYQRVSEQSGSLHEDTKKLAFTYISAVNAGPANGDMMAQLKHFQIRGS